MEKNILSKSTFIKAMQCQKQLYLYKNRYFLRDKMPPERVAIFKRGHQIGHLAQELFPGGIDLTPKSPSQYKKTVLKTKELIEDGKTDVIYEAGFQADKTLILLDILVKAEDGWEAYEVKSSLALSETYYKDAALQNYIIKKSGLNLKRFYLVHLNADYHKHGPIDLHQLFSKVDVTDEVNQHLEKIGAEIQNSIAAVSLTSSPNISIGKHCFAPYDCEFIGHCWKKEAKPNFFNLPDLSLDEKQKLHEQFNGKIINAINSQEIPEEVSRQIKAWVSNEPYVDKTIISSILSDKPTAIITKPFFYKSAMPLFNGDAPYQKRIFAYGVLTLEKKTEGSYRRRIDVQIADCDEESLKKFEAKFDDFLFNNSPLMYEDENGKGLIQVFKQGAYVHPCIQESFSLHDVVKIWNPNWKANWDCPSDLVAAHKFMEIFQDEDVEYENVELIENYLNAEMNLLAELIQHLQAL